MKALLVLAALAGTLLAAPRVFGATPDTAPSPPAAPAAAMPASPEVERATLGNGLRVVIVRDALAPVVTTQVTYRAGGYETPAGYPGTAHALEHMMFRGSRELTGAQLDELTGKLGAENNAFTTNDATQYFFLAPAAYLDVLLRIEAGRMRGALLQDKDWKTERGAIEQEVSRDISDPSFLAFQEAERDLYAGTGYAEDPLGTRPSFDRTSAKALRAFYDAWYQPGNAVLVIVGDVDPLATLGKVKALFGGIASHATPPRNAVALRPFKPRTIERTTPSATGSVQLLYRMPGLMSEENAAAQILMDVLNNPRGGLSELAARGKVLSTDAEIQPFSQGGIGTIEASIPRGSDPVQAREYLDGVIEAILRDGVPAELVDASKRAEAAQFEFSKNSASTLATVWSQALAWQGLDSPQQAEDQIQRVTVADVDRVARKYLRHDARVTIVLKPDVNGKRPPESTGFGGNESFAGNPKSNVPLPEWAAQALGNLDLPHWTLSPVRMQLSNGLTLIVQPEAISKTVTVVGHIDHDAGMQEPARQEGVGRLLSSLFDYGTTTLDRTAFHKALDDIAANAHGGEDFELAVPSRDFDRGLQLLADNELHPALPREAFTIQRQSLAQLLVGELQSPQYKRVRALKRGLLPAADPSLREATPNTVDKLTLDDAKRYFEASYRPDLTTLVVVGDITPEGARAAVEKYFGDWTGQGPKPSVEPPRLPANPPAFTIVANPFASQDTVIMGEVLDIDLHDPDRYALELGNDILGGNGFASRLMLDIRVRRGYAYGAGSRLQLERTRGVFYVEYGSDPAKVPAVDALVLDDIKAMQNSPITDEELANARQFRIRSIPLEVSSVIRIALALENWSYHDEPLDQPMLAARRYLELTSEQVRDAFHKHLQLARFVEVVEGPKPPKDARAAFLSSSRP